MSVIEYYTGRQAQQLLRLSRKQLLAYVEAGILRPVLARNGTEYFWREEVRHVARFTVPSQAAARFLLVSREGLVDLGNQGYVTPLVQSQRRRRYDPQELAVVRAHLANYLHTHTAVCKRLNVSPTWLWYEMELGHVSYVRVGAQLRVSLQEARQHVQSCHGVKVLAAARILQTSPRRVRYLARRGHLAHLTMPSGVRLFQETDLQWHLKRK